MFVFGIPLSPWRYVMLILTYSFPSSEQSVSPSDVSSYNENIVYYSHFPSKKNKQNLYVFWWIFTRPGRIVRYAMPSVASNITVSETTAVLVLSVHGIIFHVVMNTEQMMTTALPPFFSSPRSLLSSLFSSTILHRLDALLWHRVCKKPRKKQFKQL